MPKSRTRSRSRQDRDRAGAPEREPATDNTATPSLNGRWTGYHPTLLEEMNRGRLQALRAGQAGERRDD